MQSSDLKNILNQFPSISQNLYGVFSIDTVPKNIPKNHFVIINTEENSQPGKHWFCLLKLGFKSYEIFDSLGIDENKFKYFETYSILPCNSKVKYNENAVQNSFSTTCGLFVCYFLIQRMHNLDLSFFTLINEIFDIDKDKNESVVSLFAKEHFI